MALDAQGLGSRNVPWYISRARVHVRMHRRVTLQDQIGFFRMLVTLLAGGTPLLEGVQTAASQAESLRLKACLEKISRSMEMGSGFHASAANFPEIFDPYWVQLIRTGEVTGQLQQVLLRLVTFLEASAALRATIVKALAYPAVLVFISIVAVFVLTWKVVPTFTLFFKDMGGKLPAITRFVIGLSDFMQAYGGYIVLGSPVAMYLIRKYLKSEMGNRQFTNVVVVTPLLGETMVELSMQKFCSNLALLLKSGTDLLDSVKMLQMLFKNFPIYSDALGQVQRNLGLGRELSWSLEQALIFTKLVCNMVRVGETSGQLVPVLEQLDIYYSKRSQDKIIGLAALMEPLIVIFMGVIVGGLLASIYIPMFNMSSGSRQ